MAAGKFVISSIEQMGFNTYLTGLAPTTDFVEVAIYCKTPMSTWELVSTYQNYETREFRTLINSPTVPGPTSVVICDKTDGVPPNQSSSNEFPHTFPDFG